jgi:hypothetical protein
MGRAGYDELGFDGTLCKTLIAVWANEETLKNLSIILIIVTD